MSGRFPLTPALAAALLALAGCSPTNAPARDQPKAAAAETPGPTASPTAAVSPATSVQPASAPKTGQVTARRCGWLQNPTPGNYWLVDSQGQWVLSTQGKEGVPGMDDMPDMTTAGWVETNGHYGYGCACMTITSDPSGDVLSIASPVAKPLKQCRSDKALPDLGE